MQSTLHIHLYLVYKKLKYFTTQTCEVIKIRQTVGTSIQVILHYIHTWPMHFIIQPLLWITVGQITRELPCNSRLEFFAVSQLHFDILARQDHTTWFNHSLLCQPKTAWQSGLQVLRLTTWGRQTHLQACNHTEMHFIKVQSALFATMTNPTKIAPFIVHR